MGTIAIYSYADSKLWAGEAHSTANAVELAIIDGADLRGAVLTGEDLSGANLAGADLRVADLTGANLTGAKLEGANLAGASLTGAILTDASLTGAKLEGADLTGANLTGANLTGANLEDADLEDASLEGANLEDANLEGASLEGANIHTANLIAIRADVMLILDNAPGEILGLIKALDEGRFDGSLYEGECACLVGTIANVRGVPYYDLEDIRPDANRQAERFALAISEGDTPKTNSVAAILREWIVEWQESHRLNEVP